MSRRAVVMFLVAILALLLPVVGCGGDSGSTSDGYKAAMATDVGKLGDKSFNDGVWAGLEQAGTDLGANVSYLISEQQTDYCLLYTSPSPRDRTRSRMPSSA